MRLARKLTLGLVVGILVVVGVFDYRLVEDGVHSLETHVSDDLALMARGLAVALPELVRVSGPPSAEQLIAERNGERSTRVRWVHLEAKNDDSQWTGLDPASVAELAAHGELRVVRGRHTHQERLIVYRTFRGQEPARDAVEVSESLASIRHQERRSLIAILVKSLVIVVIGSIFALALGIHFIGQPIQLLVEQARRVGAGDLSLRLSISDRRDELTELAREMNQMCDRLVEARDHLEVESAAKLAAVEQLRHADRLKTVGQLASGIAHELGTPLNVVAGHAKMIAAGDTTDDEARSGARVIVEQTTRITGIIRQLLDFARRGRPTLAMADLGEVAKRTVRMLAPLGLQRKVQLRLDPSDQPIAVTMDDGQIQQAIANIILNGIQAMPAGGEIEIDLHRGHAQPPKRSSMTAGEYVRLRVRDHGAGMTPEVLSRVFEPFFTTKSVGEGTGLGLSVTYGIIQEHGGWITASSEVGKGSCFSLFLPAVSV